MTQDLDELTRWLHELGVTHVAMESTGVYWKPVWNVLEGQFNLLEQFGHPLAVLNICLASGYVLDMLSIDQ